jgi:hypothetical protein
MKISKNMWLAVLATALTTQLAAIVPASAADCPPLGKLPTYDADTAGPTQRDFDGADFTVAKGAGSETVTVAGRTCRLAYTPRAGSDALSDLEIQSNYRQQLKQLGAQVLFTDGGNTVASWSKGLRKPGCRCSARSARSTSSWWTSNR